MGRLLLGAAVAAVLAVANLAGNMPAPAGAGSSAKPEPPSGQERTSPGQAGKDDPDPEKPSPPGQEQTPPGQSAENPEEATPTAALAGKGHENDDQEVRRGPPGDDPTEGPGTNSRGSSAEGTQANSGTTPRSANPTHGARTGLPVQRRFPSQEHVIICHRTGSESNPYVVIDVSIEAWVHGHSTHPPLDDRSDILLKRGAIPGEKLPASACADNGGVVTNDPPQATTPTGPTDPSTSGAHDADVPSSTASPTDPGGMSSTRTTQTSRGGVGAVQRLHQTAVRGTLPFTGAPLWTVLLVAIALVGFGFALRRGPQLEVARRRMTARTTGLYWRRDER